MKIILSLAVLTALVALEQATTCRAAGKRRGAGHIYDTPAACTMRRDSTAASPKYIIANRACRRCQADSSLCDQRFGPRPEGRAGLFVFSGESARSRQVRPFDAARWSSLPEFSTHAATRRWVTP